MAKITAVRVGSNNDLEAFQLEDGTVLDYNQCIQAVDGGQIEGVMLGRARDGRPTIRGVADGDESNNLKMLPRF